MEKVKTELGYWRTFKRTRDPNDKNIKELTKITKREPQKWWFPMGKGVREMLYEGPVHLFVNNDGKPVICITMKNERLHEIMGRGDGRTVEEMYKRTLAEFIRKNRKLEVQVEMLKRELEAKGGETLTDEEKTVATKGEYDFGILGKQQEKKKPAGGMIHRGFAPTMSDTARAVTTAVRKGATTLRDIESDIEKKINEIQDKMERARQQRVMNIKAEKIMRLSVAFAANQPLNMLQMNDMLDLLSDNVTSKTISGLMTLDAVSQLDKYIGTQQVQARENTDAAFKAKISLYKTSRQNIINDIDQRNQQNQQNTSQTQQGNQAQPNNPQTSNQQSQSPIPPLNNTPPPAAPPSSPPGTPPSPPPAVPPNPPPPPNTKPGPVLSSVPRPPKQVVNQTPGQVFKQGIEEELSQDLVEPKNNPINPDKRVGKSNIKPNRGAVKPGQEKSNKV